MDHAARAGELFREGYSCSQAVAMAFSDVTGLEEKLTARLVSSFGGGMGRLREVCGAVSGMLLVLGTLYGYDDAGDAAGKRELYARVQDMAGEFREENGSIICRELLQGPPADPNPTPRTEEFYKKRPCRLMVESAARIMEEFIAEHPISTVGEGH